MCESSPFASYDGWREREKEKRREHTPMEKQREVESKMKKEKMFALEKNYNINRSFQRQL